MNTTEITDRLYEALNGLSIGWQMANVKDEAQRNPREADMKALNMTLFDDFGGFKVWGRDIAGGSREFQVRQGNRILARFPYLHDAMEDAKGRMDAWWDEQAAYHRQRPRGEE